MIATRIVERAVGYQLDVSVTEAWALLAVLGRVVSGPTSSLGGTDAYNELFAALFPDGEVSDAFEAWYKDQELTFASKSRGVGLRWP